MTSSDQDIIRLEKMRAVCIEMGLEPLSWDDVVIQVKQRLTDEKSQQFLRYHRSFTAYPTEATLKRFYGFTYAKGLGDLLAKFRFHRLTSLMSWLDPMIPVENRILEIGAGSGHVLRWLRTLKHPKILSALDWVPEAQVYWPQNVFAPKENEPWDILLSLDALGESHSDEDDAILSANPNQLDQLADLIEQRYGFATKLKPLRPYFHSHTVLYLSEPIPHPLFWKALAMGLQQEGWATEVITPSIGPKESECHGLKVTLP